MNATARAESSASRSLPAATGGPIVKHPDGGTVRELQRAEIPGAREPGWAIVLTEWHTYRGNVVYEVLRYSPVLGRAARLRTSETETVARLLANREWLSDVAAYRPFGR